MDRNISLCASPLITSLPAKTFVVRERKVRNNLAAVWLVQQTPLACVTRRSGDLLTPSSALLEAPLGGPRGCLLFGQRRREALERAICK